MAVARQPSTPGVSPGEVMLLGVLAVAALVATVVWLGAALAATVAGAGPPGGLVDAFGAIPGLLQQPGDPAAAWTSPERRRVVLPGPVVYWIATIVALLAVAAVVGLLVVVWRRVSPARKRLGVDARARFASRRDLRPLLVKHPTPGRFVLGTWGRWMVATESQRWAATPTAGLAGLWAQATGRRARGRGGDVSSVAIVGPTRSGKTAECVIPGVLDWDGPAILLSVKRDLMDTTIARRRQLGQVRVFDPGGFLAQNENPDVSVAAGEFARWSPLRNAHTASGAKRAGEAIAAWTPQAGVEGGMNFWTSQGKLLFTGLLGAAALSDARSMNSVANWVFNMTMPRPQQPCEPMDILNDKLRDTDTFEAANAATMHLAAIWTKSDDKLKSSVYATAVTVVDPWLDPNVIAATDLDRGRGEWVDLDWLLDTGPEGDRANTLYLVVSNDDYKRLSPVLAGLLSDLKSQAYQWEMQGRRFPAPLLMLIDEAGNMPLDWLPEVSSTCAGVGIQLVTVWQSLAQIKQAYGTRSDILLTNHATKLFFPAASDDSTLSYQSKLAGEEEVERQSWSTDVAGGSHRRSISGQDQQVPLVAYWLARLPRFGQSLMIHSNSPPAQVTGRRWWLDRRLTEMVPHSKPVRRRRERPEHRGPWTPTRRPDPPPGRHVDGVRFVAGHPAGTVIDTGTGEVLTEETHP
jgi:type IV secretion system protein VirD4